MKLLPIKHKGLTYIAVIDKADWRKVKKHSWHIHHSNGTKKKIGQPYARATIDGKKVYLHRHLTGAMLPMHVDHKNNQTLDYRQENLKVSTHEENMRNRRKLRQKKKDKKQIMLPYPDATRHEIPSIPFVERLRP